MNEALSLLLHSDPAMVLALAGLVGACSYGAKKIFDAIAVAIREWSAARAKATVATAEGEKSERETTGRFVTLATKDHEQLASFYAETRAALRKCDEDRAADRKQYEAEISELRARVEKLEREKSEIAASRAKLWEELQQWHRARDSGGAYDEPADLTIEVREENKQ